jgi:hypothetical protein
VSGLQWLFEIVLTLLLLLTLIQAVRLEKALGVLRRDRGALEEMVSSFNDSTRQAEGGIERLRAVADGTGRQITRHIDHARTLKDDLTFLSDRASTAADRLEAMLRENLKINEDRQDPIRVQSTKTPMAGQHVPDDTRIRSQAERDLLRALKLDR